MRDPLSVSALRIVDESDLFRGSDFHNLELLLLHTPPCVFPLPSSSCGCSIGSGASGLCRLHPFPCPVSRIRLPKITRDVSPSTGRASVFRLTWPDLRSKSRRIFSLSLRTSFTTNGSLALLHDLILRIEFFRKLARYRTPRVALSGHSKGRYSSENSTRTLSRLKVTLTQGQQCFGFNGFAHSEVPAPSGANIQRLEPPSSLSLHRYSFHAVPPRCIRNQFIETRLLRKNSRFADGSNQRFVWRRIVTDERVNSVTPSPEPYLHLVLASLVVFGLCTPREYQAFLLLKFRSGKIGPVDGRRGWPTYARVCSYAAEACGRLQILPRKYGRKNVGRQDRRRVDGLMDGQTDERAEGTRVDG